MGIDPLERQEEETARLSLDLPEKDIDFLTRFAAYRNALNTLQERDVRKWTRKSAAEAFISSQVMQVSESMREAFTELGPLPPASDEKAVLAYAKRVLARSATKSR